MKWRRRALVEATEFDPEHPPLLPGLIRSPHHAGMWLFFDEEYPMVIKPGDFVGHQDGNWDVWPREVFLELYEPANLPTTRPSN